MNAFIHLQKYFSLLNVDFVHLNKSWNYQKVISPFYRVYLIERGGGILTTGYQKEVLEKDHPYLIPGFTMCNYCCTSFLHQYYVHVAEESQGQILFDFDRHFKITWKPVGYLFSKQIEFPVGEIPDNDQVRIAKVFA